MDDDVAPPTKGTRTERVRRASQERRAQQKEDLRQAILHAAGELLIKHGYEDFSLRQVAEYLGYSPTTIYLYFENKDALLFEVTDDAYRTFCEVELRAFNSTDDPLERLVAIGRSYVEFGLTHPTAYKVMMFQRIDYLMGCLAGQTEPRIDTFKASEHAVKLAMDAGAIRPGNPSAVFGAVWSAVHGLVMLALTVPDFDRAYTNEVMETLFETLLHGMKTPASE